MRPRARSLILLVLTLTVLVGCTHSGIATTHLAATTVAELLALRSAATTDPAAYTPYFADAGIAEQLGASGAEGAIPGFDTPYVSKLGGSSADVVVRWKDTDAFPGWPSATVFVMELDDGRWLVVDAVDASGTLPPPAENVAP